MEKQEIKKVVEKKSPPKGEKKPAAPGKELTKWGHRLGTGSAIMDEALEKGLEKKTLLKKLAAHSGKDEKWAQGRLAGHLRHLKKEHGIVFDPETLKRTEQGAKEGKRSKP